MDSMRHYHYDLIAHDGIKDTQFINPVQVNISKALDEKNAIEQAKKLVERAEYTLRRIWECNSCQSDEEKKKLLDEQIKFFKS